MRKLLALLMLIATLGAVAASPAAATTVPGPALIPGQPVTTTISVADQDVAYTFPTTAGQHLSFDVTASNWTNGSTPGSATIRFYNPSGSYAGACNVTTPTWCELTPGATGTMTAILDPADAATGTITFSFAYDQASRALEPQVPATTTTTIRGQDASYTFPTTAGQHLSFDVTASNWTNGSTPGSATIRFYNPSGSYAGACNVTTPTWCELTPGATGTMTAALDPANAATGTITVRFAYDLPTKALQPQVPATTTTTIRGQDASYTFPTTAGQHLSFDVTASNWTNGSTPGSATIRFYNPSGSYAGACNVTTPTWCELTPGATGTMTAALDPADAATGTITVRFAYDLPTKALQPQVPATTTTTIRGQDASYTFPTTAGQHLSFDITASNWSAGTNRHPTVLQPIRQLRRRLQRHHPDLVRAHPRRHRHHDRHPRPYRCLDRYHHDALRLRPPQQGPTTPDRRHHHHNHQRPERQLHLPDHRRTATDLGCDKIHLEDRHESGHRHHPVLPAHR